MFLRELIVGVTALFYPYVVLISGPNTIEETSAKTITDSTDVPFEALYCPPLSLEGELTGEYTYNFTFGDDSGDYYEITTNKTYAYCPAHKYLAGGPYEAKVTVEHSDPDIPTVSDNRTVIVKIRGFVGTIPKRNYLR